MELSGVRLLADRLLNEHELFEKGWSFSFDRAKRRAGSCKFSKKEITLARAYAEQEDFKEIKNTILHEIAHALVGPKHGHNEIWRQKALEIGCDAERCHYVVFSKPKYKLTCINRCFEVARYRVNQNFLHSRICSKCKGILLIFDI
ncbi:MAG TPA: transcription elongation protein SprT [Deltaproteobacteria bacterium]|nr:transcription elongation protein SprT [Deltaproteobacteria bacterium]|tara:strand:+ start:192 stop:629 length:438 start_codon:yes stop_codon:yes gene_type:complete